MQNKTFPTLKSLCISAFLLSLTTAWQVNSAEPKLPLSIIYGGIENNKKTLFMTDEKGFRHVKIGNSPDILAIGYPSVSPNGKYIAFYGKYDKYKTWSIHTADINGKNIKRLTHVKHVWDSAPTWSPDGKTIVFAREYKAKDGTPQEEMWLMNPDGSNKRKIEQLQGRSPEFMPDGRLLFQTIAGPSQIAIANIDGSNIIQLTNDDTKNMSPKISPDGKQITYVANRGGNQEVYIMDIDGKNNKRLTKNSITEWGPVWSLDGSKVLFSSQSVHGFYDIYKVNKDGSNIEKVLTNGSQARSLFHVNSERLEQDIKDNSTNFIK